jgi:hypothetical protein
MVAATAQDIEMDSPMWIKSEFKDAIVKPI